MQNLLYNISQVLGITIIHSLWQGLIIYIALRLFMLASPAVSSSIKYRITYAALTAMLGWFIYTLFKELDHYNWLSTVALQIKSISLPGTMQQLNEPASQLYIGITAYMPYLTMVYVVGLVFNTLQLTLGWNSIYRIRQNITPAGFERTISNLSKKLKVTKAVQTAFSEWVDVPCITGFIKPIILLPFSITCYLSTEEIEAVLLHELAHVKRNDYLLNFIQQVMGIWLFFNPFARLINKLINEERENCCDDIVVHVTGSPFIYAQALLKLEENKQHQWQLALAATGKKYELLNRIERIMKTKTQTVNIRPILITLLALTCSITSIAWLNPEIKDGKVIIKNAPAIRMIAAAITAPRPEPKPVVMATPKHKHHLIFKFDDSVKTRLNDTSIRNKKYKIIVEDENGNKKEYNSVNDLPADVKGDFYARSADSARAEAMKAYFTNQQWKKQQADIQRQAAEMTKQFNSPEWKKQQAKIQKQAAEIAKTVKSAQFKKQPELLAMQAKKMAKLFDSPEWKKQQEDLVKKSEDFAKSYTESPEWKKQQEEYAKMGEEYAQKFINTPEWKKQQDDIVKSAMDMAKQFSGPDWEKNQKLIEKQAREISKKAEKMAKQFNSPEWKEKMKEINKKQLKQLPPADKPEAPEKPEQKEKPEVQENSPL